MAFYFATWWTEFYFCIFIGILTYYFYFKTVGSKYWKRRNIANAEPVFLLGNLWKLNILESFGPLLGEFYMNWKHEKLLGIWNFTKPVLVVNDLDIIKNILVKDFSHFQNHGFEVDAETDPLANHLFNLKGAKWRNMRVKLTPTFTSGKMKMMFPTIVECGEELQEYLKKVVEDKREVEVKEIMARFTTDIISSCAFGIQANSLKNPNAEFRQYGRKFLEPTLEFRIRQLIFLAFPQFFKMLKLPLIPPEMTKYFVNIVQETMDYRETNKVKRNDFMELLIQLKNKGKLDDVDGVVPTPPETDVTQVSDISDTKFTMNDAVAQAFVFFFAGFETSSTTLTFALYELALNTDVQETVQNEIDRLLAKENGKITYEAVMDMEYLDWLIQETLRKYPPAAPLFRKCNKPYEIPELNVKIDENCSIFIPVHGIHRDPEIYPNPDKFDPTRFSPEEKAKRHHFAFLPFGEGPRMCIGNRFALVQTKIGLVSILSRYNVLVSTKTPSPLVFDPKASILSAKGGMHLKFTQRN